MAKTTKRRVARDSTSSGEESGGASDSNNSNGTSTSIRPRQRNVPRRAGSTAGDEGSQEARKEYLDILIKIAKDLNSASRDKKSVVLRTNENNDQWFNTITKVMSYNVQTQNGQNDRITSETLDMMINHIVKYETDPERAGQGSGFTVSRIGVLLSLLAMEEKNALKLMESCGIIQRVISVLHNPYAQFINKRNMLSILTNLTAHAEKHSSIKNEFFKKDNLAQIIQGTYNTCFGGQQQQQDGGDQQKAPRKEDEKEISEEKNAMCVNALGVLRNLLSAGSRTEKKLNESAHKLYEAGCSKLLVACFSLDDIRIQEKGLQFLTEFLRSEPGRQQLIKLGIVQKVVDIALKTAAGAKGNTFSDRDQGLLATSFLCIRLLCTNDQAIKKAAAKDPLSTEGFGDTSDASEVAKVLSKDEALLVKLVTVIRKTQNASPSTAYEPARSFAVKKTKKKSSGDDDNEEGEDATTSTVAEEDEDEPVDNDDEESQRMTKEEGLRYYAYCALNAILHGASEETGALLVLKLGYADVAAMDLRARNKHIKATAVLACRDIATFSKANANEVLKKLFDLKVLHYLTRIGGSRDDTLVSSAIFAIRAIVVATSLNGDESNKEFIANTVREQPRLKQILQFLDQHEKSSKAGETGDTKASLKQVFYLLMGLVFFLVAMPVLFRFIKYGRLYIGLK
eukprot:GEZU01019870.1.p1 GENE.GEZU01019870.1~~GEZU01019870.1.p1  ORF type:complete len:682 (-),score=246.43 GEZU01019870.1:105-2150(-)